MGDKDDGLVLVPHFPHDAVDAVAPLLAERGGRFVDHQDLRVLVNSLGDFHQLAVLHVQRLDRCGGIHPGKADGVQGLLCFADHGRAVDEDLAEAVLFAEEDVFRNRDAGDGALLLHDHADAQLGTLDHGGRVMRLSLEEHLAGGRRLHAGENGGDGRLARAVFSDQPGDLPAVDLDRYILQRYRGAEVFAEIPGFDNQLVLLQGNPPLRVLFFIYGQANWFWVSVCCSAARFSVPRRPGSVPRGNPDVRC